MYNTHSDKIYVLYTLKYINIQVNLKLVCRNYASLDVALKCKDQLVGFFPVLWFSPPIKLTVTI